MNIKISILMPCYNAAGFVLQSLQSAQAQTLREIEIICINDGSTDNTGTLLEKCAQEDNRVRVFHQENQGEAPTRNTLLTLAQGEFICFLDADDYYPDATVLETLYVKAVENNVKIAGGKLFTFDDNNNKVFSNAFFDYLFMENKVLEYRDCQFDYGFTRFIYKLDFLKERKLYFPNYKRYTDTVFFVRAMLYGEKFYAVNMYVYAYRVNYKPLHFTERVLQDLRSGIKSNIRFAVKNKLYVLCMLSCWRFIVDVILPYLKNKKNKSIPTEQSTTENLHITGSQGVLKTCAKKTARHVFTFIIKINRYLHK